MFHSIQIKKLERNLFIQINILRYYKKIKKLQRERNAALIGVCYATEILSKC